MGFFIDFLVVVFKRIIGQTAARGSDAWPLAEGTVTAPPRAKFRLGRQSIELVYSYRFQGELYTGDHEQSFVLGRSLPDYVKRFGKGSRLAVRVKPEDPEVSVVRNEDQGASPVSGFSTNG
ncbi:MAG: DUF3592 domain-containing protein [Candidatus Sulfotelmatobacter sp.]